MRYISKKLLFFILALLVALIINFLLPRLMPGDPIGIMLDKNQLRVGEEVIESLKEIYEIDSDEILVIQFINYLKRIFTGNFGTSISYHPFRNIDVIKNAIPWTLGLVGVSLILSFILGTLLGIFSAWNRNSFLSNIVTSSGLFFRALPYFWVALIFIYLFAFKSGWFPLSGPYSPRTEPGLERFVSIIHHGFLPVLTNVIISIGTWILMMRNNMISVMGEDYIEFARAKGLSNNVIKYNYAARNALLPSFTGFAIALGFIIGGNVFTEIVFSYPGLGYILYRSVINLDYRLMETCFLFITLTVLTINFIADVLYILIDPRIRTGKE